jgi:hypothetical protein
LPSVLFRMDPRWTIPISGLLSLYRQVSAKVGNIPRLGFGEVY